MLLWTLHPGLHNHYVKGLGQGGPLLKLLHGRARHRHPFSRHPAVLRQGVHIAGTVRTARLLGLGTEDLKPPNRKLFLAEENRPGCC